MTGSTSSRHYKDGDIICHEGEASDAAFVIMSGQVELTKSGQQGMVIIGTLQKGDLFGEMGVLDKGPRSATATAVGEVEIKVIPADLFIKQIQNDSETALKIMTRLAKRLRKADEMLVAQDVQIKAFQSGLVPVSQGGQADATAGQAGLPTTATTHAPRQQGRGLWDRLFGSLKQGAESSNNPSLQKPITITLTRLDDDIDDLERQLLESVLAQIPGLSLKINDRIVAPWQERNGGPLDVRTAALTARQWLAEEAGDVLLWGGIEETGRLTQLRAASTAPLEDERPGAISPITVLNLPLDFDETWEPLATGFILAAIAPHTQGQMQFLQTHLPPLVEKSKQSGFEAVPGLSAMEQAQITGSWASITALTAYYTGSEKLYREAVAAFKKTLSLLEREAEEEFVLFNRYLGMCQQTLGERKRDSAMLQESAESYRAALEGLQMRDNPRDWAWLNNRLGMVLCKIDMLTGDADALRDGLAAYQSALKVYTRASEPVRWAEVMNNMGQALQVWGDHLKSPDVLQRAIDACLAALEVRTREADPLGWAATQNNMGSALFLLGRHTEDLDAINKACDAFRNALDIYHRHGANRLAKVTERNLTHADAILKAQNPKKVKDPSWAEEGFDRNLDDDAGPVLVAGQGTGAEAAARPMDGSPDSFSLDEDTPQNSRTTRPKDQRTASTRIP